MEDIFDDEFVGDVQAIVEAVSNGDFAEALSIEVDYLLKEADKCMSCLDFIQEFDKNGKMWKGSIAGQLTFLHPFVYQIANKLGMCAGVDIPDLADSHGDDVSRTVGLEEAHEMFAVTVERLRSEISR